MTSHNSDTGGFLVGLASRLEDAYAVCVTAEFALVAQNADHAAEIARCLRAAELLTVRD
jgi:hypothetical protein